MSNVANVTVEPEFGQIVAAALLQKALDDINYRARFGKGPLMIAHELCYIGAGSLSLYYGIWDKVDHNLAERKLLIPSQHLTLDLLLIPQAAFDNVEVETHEGDQVAKHVLERARLLVPVLFPGTSSQIHPSHHFEPTEFFCPRPRFSSSDSLVVHHAYFDIQRPRGRLQGQRIFHELTLDEHVAVTTLHPAHFFIRVLERIRIESINMHTTNNLELKRLHSHRRSAQVFLLRLFVELLEDTIHSDPTKSDAIWKPRLETALPKDYESFDQFVWEVSHHLVIEVAEQQAEWQIGLEHIEAHHVESRYRALVWRNTRTFKVVEKWLHPEESIVEPPSYNNSPPRPPPSHPSSISSIPTSNPFIPERR